RRSERWSTRVRKDVDDCFVDVTVPLVVTARRQFADMCVEILVSRQREVGRRAAPQLALVHRMRAEVLEGHALIQVFLAEFLALARLIDGALVHVPHLWRTSCSGMNRDSRLPAQHPLVHGT